MAMGQSFFSNFLLGIFADVIRGTSCRKNIVWTVSQKI